MNIRCRNQIAIMLFVVSFVSLAWKGNSMAETTETGKLVASEFQGSVTKQFRYKYLVYLPTDYAHDSPKPLVLFLHGMGERGDDLDRVKSHGPARLISDGKQFPFICVSPLCPDGRWWSSDGLAALLDEIESKYAVDKQRVYVTGLSMGGFGTWVLAAAQPERFAAIAPICGGASYFDAAQLKDLPIWCFHGGADQVVPVSESTRLLEMIERKGGGSKNKLTIYDGVGHDSWTQTYANNELYEWLLSHKLSEDSPDEDTPNAEAPDNDE